MATDSRTPPAAPGTDTSYNAVITKLSALADRAQHAEARNSFQLLAKMFRALDAWCENFNELDNVRDEERPNSH